MMLIITRLDYWRRKIIKDNTCKNIPFFNFSLETFLYNSNHTSRCQAMCQRQLYIIIRFGFSGQQQLRPSLTKHRNKKQIRKWGSESWFAFGSVLLLNNKEAFCRGMLWRARGQVIWLKAIIFYISFIGLGLPQ